MGNKNMPLFKYGGSFFLKKVRIQGTREKLSPGKKKVKPRGISPTVTSTSTSKFAFY
jgi:hypothetical protein